MKLPKCRIMAAILLASALTGKATAQDLDNIPLENLWGAGAIAKYDSLLQSGNKQLSKCATRELEEIARLLKASNNTLQPGVQPLKKSNITYEITTDKAGVITHIGANLFPASTKKLLSGKYLMIYNFIERNNLYLRLLEPNTRSVVASTLGLEYEEKQFFNINDSANVTMRDFPNEKKFLFQWTDKKGNILCNVKFPMNYSLISGLDMEEIQNKLEFELQHHTAKGNVTMPTINPNKLLQQNGIYVNKGDHYIIEEFNANTYYADNLGQKPVNSVQYPVETLANILTGITPSGITANVTQNKYGLKKSNYTVKLNDLIDFFYANNCHPYFGVERVTDSEIVALVIYENTELFYNHLLNVTINTNVIAKGSGTIKINAYCYIPTHNLKALFGELENKKTNKK